MRIDQLPVAAGVVNANTLPVNVDGSSQQVSVGELANAIRSDVYGAPLTAATAADMTDTTRVYVYVGSETGYVNGDWYYYDGSAWVSGGAYNSTAVQTDPTLTLAGVPADAAAVGAALAEKADEISDLKSQTNSIDGLLFGLTQMTWTDGIYGANGYNTSTAKWVYSQKLNAGSYNITVPNGFRYQVYNYVSDSSGTVNKSATTIGGNLVFSNTVVISVGLSANTNLSDSDKATIQSGFVVSRNDSDVPAYSENNIINLDASAITYPLGAGERIKNPDGLNYIYRIYNANGTQSRIQAVLPANISPTGIYEVDAKVYIPDVTKISAITISLYGTSCARDYTALKNGWNDIAVYTFQGDVTTWGNITRILVTATGTAGQEWYLSEISYKRAAKAWILFIEDLGYSTFFENGGYADLISLGVPLTLAYDCGTPGKDLGTRGTQLTVEQVETYVKQGYMELSFHGWNSSEPTASMTAGEIRAEAAKCINMLQKNGLQPEHVWRAAHIQNSATNASAEIGMVEALATSTEKATAYNVYPYIDKWDIPRATLHGKTDAQIDAIFDTLQKTHCGAIIYTHGISSLSDYDVTQATWDYFIGKLTTAVNGGWLIGVTHNDLANGKMG